MSSRLSIPSLAWTSQVASSRIGLILAATMVVGAPLPALATTLIAQNSTWKYFAGPNDLGDAWREASYDDSAWPSGPGPLGYGEPYIQTMVSFGPDSRMKY